MAAEEIAFGFDSQNIFVAGETIRRPVPGFSGTFSGDTFVPFSAT